MIRVEWRTHVDIDDIVRQALQQRLEEIGAELEDVRCPTHGNAPVLIVTGTSVESVSANVESCCEELGRLARATLESMGFQDDGTNTSDQ